MKHVFIFLLLTFSIINEANSKKVEPNSSKKIKQPSHPASLATRPRHSVQSLGLIESTWQGKSLTYRCCRTDCCQTEAEKFLSCENNSESFFIPKATIGSALEQCHYTADAVVLKDGTKIPFIKQQVKERISKTNLLNLRRKFVNCEHAKSDGEDSPDRDTKAAAAIYLEKNACTSIQASLHEKDRASEKANLYHQAKEMIEKGNLTEAKRHYLKLCEVGEMSACGGYGDLQDQTGNTKDAVQFTKRACEGGVTNYCLISKKYEEKIEVVAADPVRQKKKADLAAIKSSFVTSCEQNNMDACYSLAGIEYQLGNRSEAKKHAEKACQGKQMDACNFLTKIISQ